MKLSATLRSPIQAHQFYQKAEHETKGWLVAGGGDLHVSIRPITRSIAQNSLLHSVLQDIAKTVEWHGKKFDALVWKRLCMAAWLREAGDNPLLIPALDGNGFDVVFERTSKLTTTQCSSLIEWCFAFGAQNGAVFAARGVEDC